jgi:hypothetical protein
MAKENSEPGARPRRPGRSRRQSIAGGATLLAVAVLVGLTAHWLTMRLEPVGASAPSATPARSPSSRNDVVWRQVDGTVYHARIDGARLAQFLEECHESTKKAREEGHALIRAGLPPLLDPIFSEIAARVPSYADWYYRYDTRYVLMAQALIPAVTQLVGSPADALHRRDAFTQAVIDHVTGYLQEQYGDRVLHPGATASAIQAAIDQTMTALEIGWLREVDWQRTRMQTLIKAAGPAEPLSTEAAGRQPIDWDGREIQASVLHQHQAVPQQFRRGLLTVTFAIPEDVSGLPSGIHEHQIAEDNTDEISHVILNLFGKVADPIASAVGNVAIGVVAGGFAAGASAAPPAAVLIGFGVTVGSEMISNRLEESLTREDFERSLRDSIDKTRQDVEATIIAAFDRHIDQWVAGIDARIAQP